MKLKAIFIIFNILIGVSFLFVFLMPAFFLGWEYATTFWSSNWYLAVLFVAVLAVLNVYFGRNWRLFTALEREDWDGVIAVLENRVFQKHRANTGNIRLLVNAYVVRSKTEGITRLEEELREHNPSALRKNALILGIPHLLSNDGEEIATYYGEFVDTTTGSQAEWLQWSRAFGLMLQQRAEEARSTLETLCENGSDTVVRALSGYLLEAYAAPDGVQRERIDRTRDTITKKYTAAEWDRIVEKARSDLYVLILSKLLRDVRGWLYGSNDE